MKKLIAGVVIAAVASGCISVNKNDGGTSCIKPCQIKDKVHVKYSVEDKTVSAKDQIHCLFGFICWGSSASHAADNGEFGFTPATVAKNGAYANACEAASCDQIAAARYKVTTKDYFVYKKVDAEITGYPVKVTGVEVVDALKCPNGESEKSGAAGAPSNALLKFIK
jgi:hypothetical protein